jgi:formyl-CoA transferase
MTYEGAPPAFSAPGSGDHATATALFASIMIALRQRDRTGTGAEVGTSLLGNGLWANGILAQGALLGAVLPNRPPRTRPRSAVVNQYRTADERWLNLTLAREEKMWPVFCRVIERLDLIDDPRFREVPARRANGTALAAILDLIFATRTLAEWGELFKAARITFGDINRLADIAGDPQPEAAGAVRKTANPVLPRSIANPLRVDFAEQRAARPAPELGEHTDAILRDLGYGDSDIAALRKSGAVG